MLDAERGLDPDLGKVGFAFFATPHHLISIAKP
jgi:hypothetical protein